MAQPNQREHVLVMIITGGVCLYRFSFLYLASPKLSGASAHVKICLYSEFLSLQNVANPIMHCNATAWRDIYIVEVMNSDVNATFYIELVNYIGHVSVE